MATGSLFSMLGFSIQPVNMAENRSFRLQNTLRKTQTDVAFVMTFRVNCGDKQKQPILTVSSFYHSEFKRNFSLLSIINLTLFLFVDMEFLFSCSTRYLTRSLRSLVRCRAEHEKRNSIFTRAHVLFSISFVVKINKVSFHVR